MTIKDGFLLRTLGDVHVVVPIGQAAVDLRGMITLNGTGAFLWKQLESSQTLLSLCEALTAVYDVTADVAMRDVTAFLELLRTNDLLQEDTPPASTEGTL